VTANVKKPLFLDRAMSGGGKGETKTEGTGQLRQRRLQGRLPLDSGGGMGGGLVKPRQPGESPAGGRPRKRGRPSRSWAE